MEEVEKHNSKESCWLVAHGFVYDATKFLPHHPAGLLPNNSDTKFTFNRNAVYSEKGRWAGLQSGFGLSSRGRQAAVESQQDW